MGAFYITKYANDDPACLKQHSRVIYILCRSTLVLWLLNFCVIWEIIVTLECCVSYIEKVYPSEGNFLLIKVDDATKRYNQLIGLGVVIRNRTTQALCENCLRISVGICEENQKLLRALKSLN